MYGINIDLLYHSLEIFIMKKKDFLHPRLFVDIEFIDSHYNLFFKHNKFDDKGNRIIEKNIISVKEITEEPINYLVSQNVLEYANLKKYIHIQKRVLQKHQKARNYDAINILEASILSMNEFKNEFECWFTFNEVKI